MFSGANPTTPKNSLSGDKRHDLLQSAKVCSCVRVFACCIVYGYGANISVKS